MQEEIKLIVFLALKPAEKNKEASPSERDHVMLQVCTILAQAVGRRVLEPGLGCRSAFIGCNCCELVQMNEPH